MAVTIIDGVRVDDGKPTPSIEEINAIAEAENLAVNTPRYVLENQYIVLCDALRTALGQTATQTKLGFEELPGMMLTLKAGSKDSYEKFRDAMDMVNSALVRYDVRWWDTARWHSEPLLVNAAQQILGMV